MDYPNSVLVAFDNGAVLDLRLRLAMELLKTPMFENALTIIPNLAPEGGTVQATPAHVATQALDLAGALVEQSQTRGWIKALPDDDALPGALKKHIQRSVRANVHQQTVAQKIAAEDGPKVALGGGGFHQ